MKTNAEFVIKLNLCSTNLSLKVPVRQGFYVFFYSSFSCKEATLRHTAIIHNFHSHYSNCMQGASTNECVQ